MVKDFDIGSFIPAVRGTPLDDAKFENMVFVWAPSGGAVSGLSPSVLTPDIAAAAKLTVDKIDLKPGVNVIGKMVIQRDSKVGKLLVKVGAYKSSMPLVGNLSPAIFRNVKNAGASIKNEILDHLNIKIPLPKLSLPGMSSVATIRKTNLTIKGKKTGNVRVLDVDVAGELDVRVAGKTVAFDFDVDIVKPPGKPAEVSINGHTEPGKKITVNLFHPFTLDSLKFSMPKEKAGWKWQVAAKTKFGSKPLDVSYVHLSSTNNFMIINTKMTMKDIAGGINLPGLDDVELDQVQISKTKWSLFAKVKGNHSILILFKHNGSTKHFVSVQIGKVSPADIIPDAEKTPLKDVEFSGLSFLYNPTKTNVAANDSKLPGEVRTWLEKGGTGTTIRPGLNVFGHMIVHPTGEMAKLLKKVGVTTLKMPLDGGFSPKAFSKNLSGTAIKNAILDQLNIKVALPPLKIPEVDKVVTFRNGHLRIRGKTPDGKTGIFVDLGGEADFHIAGGDLDFDIDVQEVRAGGKNDLKISGKMAKPWVHPLGLTYLTFDSVAASIDIKSGGNKTVSLTAKTDIGKHKRLDVKITAKEVNGVLADTTFELDGPIDLSEIPGANKIPHASKFGLTSLKISRDGIEAKTTLGGRATDIALFTGSGWNAAITQKNFTITELIPPLKHTPLKHIGFPSATLLISDGGIDKHYGDLGSIAQDVLKELYSDPGALVQIASGITFIAGFHPDNAGAMKDAVKGIGVHEGVMLQGSIGGLFGGGTPLVRLKGILSSAGKPGSMPKFMKFAKNAELDFFINVSESGQDFDFELGLGVGVNTKIGSDELLFDAKVKLQIMEEGFGIDIEGQMLGTWHKPFGIPFALSNVTLEVGTQEDGAIKLGFAGTTGIGGQSFSMAADVELLPEALGAPQAIAFKATASELDFFFLDDVAMEMVLRATGKAGIHLPVGKLPQPKIKNAMLAFATPGAEDPDLGLVSEGFAMKGTFFFPGQGIGHGERRGRADQRDFRQGQAGRYPPWPAEVGGQRPGR